MTYSLDIGRRPQKDLGKLLNETAARLRRAIASLAENPRPPGCLKLVGGPEWRVRVGDYRVVYTIDDDTRVVTIVAVGHRRDIYG